MGGVEKEKENGSREKGWSGKYREREGEASIADVGERRKGIKEK